jgi:hypothetical protein
MPFSKLDYRYLCPFRRACILRNLGVPDYHITIGGRIKVRQYQPVAILSAQDVPDFSCGVSLSPCHDALCRHGCMEVGCGVALRIDLRPGSALESEPSLVVVGRRTVLSGLAGGNSSEQKTCEEIGVARYPDRRCSAVCSREKI